MYQDILIPDIALLSQKINERLSGNPTCDGKEPAGSENFCTQPTESICAGYSAREEKQGILDVEVTQAALDILVEKNKLESLDFDGHKFGLQTSKASSATDLRAIILDDSHDDFLSSALELSTSLRRSHL